MPPTYTSTLNKYINPVQLSEVKSIHSFQFDFQVWGFSTVQSILIKNQILTLKDSLPFWSGEVDSIQFSWCRKDSEDNANKLDKQPKHKAKPRGHIHHKKCGHNTWSKRGYYPVNFCCILQCYTETDTPFSNSKIYRWSTLSLFKRFRQQWPTGWQIPSNLVNLVMGTDLDQFQSVHKF